jgi:chemotaxis protein histidine kinase CheA
VRKIIIPVTLALVLVSCVTSPTTNAYSDGTLIAEQRAEIKQLKRDLTDMATTQREVSARIDSITTGLTDSLARCATIEDIFAEMDRFVREVIDENNKLRSFQRADQPADAGE